MEWNERLENIIEYVEAHLQREEGPISADAIAELAGCSYDFFQKVFSYMNGISFAEYVRFRKLTLAGYDLKSTDLKVIEVSYKYGYESPTSFTRAFQQFHGISPKAARSRREELRVYPRMGISAKPQYAWRIEQKESVRLIGKSIILSVKDGNRAAQIPCFWNECQQNGVFSQMVAMDSADPPGLYGLFLSPGGTDDQMEYAIMVSTAQDKPEGFIEETLPEMTWAVFDCRGPSVQAIQTGWKFLKEEWLNQYPFAHASCPEVEWYSRGNAYGEDYLSQIWIPIMLEE